MFPQNQLQSHLSNTPKRDTCLAKSYTLFEYANQSRAASAACRWCAAAIVVAVICSVAGPAAAQFNPALITVDLSQNAVRRSASVTTTIAPSCTLTSPQTTVNVATLLPAAPISGIDTSTAQLVFGCNTPAALLSISSSGALLNAAPVPIGREATKFTTRLPFSARADLLNLGQVSGTSIWTLSDNAAIGATNLAVGIGTGQRIRTVSVKAQGITSTGLIPVSGAYTGAICVGVDPAGVIGAPECTPPVAQPATPFGPQL
jgi:hypothetical protein